jgi:uncharacterized membrane protein
MTTIAIILGLLTAPLLLGIVLNRLAGRSVASPHLLGCVGITLVFGFTGIGHFVQTGPMAEMLPPWVPARIPLVYVTGVLEIAAALVVLVPRWRTEIGWVLVALLLLFLPVNIHAAVNRVGIGGHVGGPVYLLIRIPLQAILIAWIWCFAIRPVAISPIRFSCEATMDLLPEEIAGQILDLDRWSDFAGFGPLPGIKSAEFEIRTPTVIGTKVRVTNTDGSSHVEEIAEWQPERRLQLRMQDFSPPLSRLATSFDETWEFERSGNQTRVLRSFEMHPTTSLARPVLWLISRLLKRAITRHLEQLRGSPTEI